MERSSVLIVLIPARDNNTVSRILHHIHPCLIYEAIMRHTRDKYEAIMKQISLNISKNEVLGPAFCLLPNHYKTVVIDFSIDICQKICIEVKPKIMENLTTLISDSQ